MKQIELNLQKRLLIIEAPDNFIGTEIINDKSGKHTIKVNIFKDKDIYWFFPFEQKGKLKLLCKGSELTEEIARDLVPEKMNVFIPQFWNYKDNEDLFYATESFTSAIEAQGYYWGENPYSNYKSYSEEHLKASEELFNQAESKTFNPEKTLIFEIL